MTDPTKKQDETPRAINAEVSAAEEPMVTEERHAASLNDDRMDDSQLGDHQHLSLWDIALVEYRKKIDEHERVNEQLRGLRKKVVEVEKKFKESEHHAESMSNPGQFVAEVLKKLDEERYIVKIINGARYVVGCRPSLKSVEPRSRVSLDMTTMTIMLLLPREVDPLVYQMSHEDPGGVNFQDVGGLEKQLQQLREVVELPLLKPEVFRKVGVQPPKGCLLYGPPGTGKTLLARAIASQMRCSFLKVVASAIIQKYIGESSRMVREMFSYARANEPCIIFVDEIDAIGGRRLSESNASDREVQRTLMELLNQMDGFDPLGKVKLIMATNRPDTLDPALLRPGRLDRKIEIPLPNAENRLSILKIHADRVAKQGDIDYGAIVKLSDGFSGADLRNVCTEAGMFAIRAERDYATQKDFMNAARKVADAKKLETKLDYAPV